MSEVIKKLVERMKRSSAAAIVSARHLLLSDQAEGH
jgi:hypothetical protein